MRCVDLHYFKLLILFLALFFSDLFRACQASPCGFWPLLPFPPAQEAKKSLQRDQLALCPYYGFPTHRYFTAPLAICT
ncbi:hypothetical protein EV421DRAFT_1799383 [Armillaria borealis]|uniref:Secreted protein n=1 Tax=Armillaria borealis TaxID=47425 RepID=A0AA39JLL6_9AGAR|nr:hypothetical protein EV421DRAFT_1799383 [Armillaria borealis]